MAIFLGKQCEASITGIFSIAAPISTEFQKYPAEGGDDEEAKNILEKAKQMVLKNEISFVGKITRGDAGYHIIKTANSKKNNFDLIVIGSRERGTAKEIFFGSVSNFVVHKSKIPVYLVK